MLYNLFSFTLPVKIRFHFFAFINAKIILRDKRIVLILEAYQCFLGVGLKSYFVDDSFESLFQQRAAFFVYKEEQCKNKLSLLKRKFNIKLPS